MTDSSWTDATLTFNKMDAPKVVDPQPTDAQNRKKGSLPPGAPGFVTNYFSFILRYEKSCFDETQIFNGFPKVFEQRPRLMSMDAQAEAHGYELPST